MSPRKYQKDNNASKKKYIKVLENSSPLLNISRPYKIFKDFIRSCVGKLGIVWLILFLPLLVASCLDTKRISRFYISTGWGNKTIIRDFLLLYSHFTQLHPDSSHPHCPPLPPIAVVTLILRLTCKPYHLSSGSQWKSPALRTSPRPSHGRRKRGLCKRIRLNPG